MSGLREADLFAGYRLLHNPLMNRGTAFTQADRRAHGLEGLLPPGVSALELQIARSRAELDNLPSDLQKSLVSG